MRIHNWQIWSFLINDRPKCFVWSIQLFCHRQYVIDKRVVLKVKFRIEASNAVNSITLMMFFDIIQGYCITRMRAEGRIKNWSPKLFITKIITLCQEVGWSRLRIVLSLDSSSDGSTCKISATIAWDSSQFLLEGRIRVEKHKIVFYVTFLSWDM